MRFLLFSLCLVGVILSATPGNSGFFSRAKATLSEPAMTDRIDPETQAPLAARESFSPDTGMLYATIKLNDAPEKTAVRAVFFLSRDEELQIAEDTVVTDGTRYISFSLNPPASGWPPGRYRVVFFLDGKEKEHLLFTVDTPQVAQRDGAVAPGPVNAAGGDAGEDTPYKIFQDKKFGYSFELPRSWNYKIAANRGDYIFQGPENSKESEITIVIQMIDTRLGKVTDLKSQMLELVDQISQVPGAKIVKVDQTSVAGRQALFFIATYKAENGAGQKVSFGHTQLGLEHEPYFILVSYSAPRQIYQERLDIFQHMVDTFQLRPPAQ